MEHENTGLTWQESFTALERGLERLVGEARAMAALVVRGDGQLLTCAGGVEGPATLGALSAGAMSASEALLASVCDGGSPSVSLDGDKRSFFLQAIDPGAFLVVLFDRQCSLGLVRLRARRLIEDARPWVAGLRRRQAGVFEELGDDEVDALFAES